MNDDYLWDKSGEPDPQIQQLEEILGTLRYQPRPLNLPRRRNYLAPLAIAATVVLALLAGGFWTQWTQIQSPEPSIPSIAIAQPANPPINPPLSVSTVSPKKRTPRLAKHDQREALAAKQQLMFALRLASEKLNTASRRTQHRAG
ncbi:MAG TPA: hypothetical protein VK893_03050 [Pyrinomonadaceae bacterium]|nr:hypothetical protein [Pyrinomonadaceae bacterium]